MSLDGADMPTHSDGLEELLRQPRDGRAVVRAIIVAIDGSTRRRVGAAMTIDEAGRNGTLGGGLAEEQVVTAARQQLIAAHAGAASWTRTLIAFPQGPIPSVPLREGPYMCWWSCLVLATCGRSAPCSTVRARQRSSRA